MENFNKKNPENTVSGVVETKDEIVINRLKELAQQTNAQSLFVFKIAEKTARSHHDMEVFLKLRDDYAKQQAAKRSRALRKRTF